MTMAKETAEVAFSLVLVMTMLLRLLLVLGALAGLAYLVSLPYLWKSREGVRPLHGFWLGYVPALVIGIAPVIMLAGVLLFRGPGFIYPAYVSVAAGAFAGTIGPLIVSELRRRMLVGWPLLMAWTYLSLMLVMAGGGMPVRLDSPLRFFIDLVG